MTENELQAMTVMQLRKLAKDQKITLGAGIDKAGIIRKILEDSQVVPSSEEAPDSEPRFQAAWHNSDAPRFNVRPAYQAPGTSPRPAWQNTTPSGHPVTRDPQRLQLHRPGSSTPRFGPAAAAPAAADESVQRPNEPAAPAVQVNPLPERRFGENSSYTHRISANYNPVYSSAARPAETFPVSQPQDPAGSGAGDRR